MTGKVSVTVSSPAQKFVVMGTQNEKLDCIWFLDATRSVPLSLGVYVAVRRTQYFIL